MLGEVVSHQLKKTGHRAVTQPPGGCPASLPQQRGGGYLGRPGQRLQHRVQLRDGLLRARDELVQPAVGVPVQLTPPRAPPLPAACVGGVATDRMTWTFYAT